MFTTFYSCVVLGSFFFATSSINIDFTQPGSHENYRIGDVVRFQDYYMGFAKRELDSRIQLNKFHLTTFPDSIASAYIQNATFSDDWTAFHDIIKVRAREQLRKASRRSDLVKAARGEVAVINIRIGDVIHGLNANSGVSSWYAYKTQMYEPIARKIASLGIKTAIVATGFPFKINQTEIKANLDYLGNLRALLKRCGVRMKLRVNKEPDLDMILFYIAKYFVPARFSGYTKTVVFARLRSEPFMMQRENAFDEHLVGER